MAPSIAGDTARVGRRAAEFAAKGVGEVAVTGKAEFEGERGEIVRAVGKSFEGRAESQTDQVAMDRRAGSLVKDACEMKGRRSRGAGDVVERDAVAQSA